jgi:hypothetical protein
MGFLMFSCSSIRSVRGNGSVRGSGNVCSGVRNNVRSGVRNNVRSGIWLLMHAGL